jgi:hypothetical protein
MNLAIDIGLSHMVQINQCEMPHPAARKSFNGPRPHAPNTDNSHMSGTYALSPQNTVQSSQSSKSSFHIHN